MGYSFTIGDLKKVVEKYEEDGVIEEYENWSAETIELENAPAFGEPTDRTNERWPSYSAWSEFAEFTNIYDLIYSDTGHLIGSHPGYLELTDDFQKNLKKRKKEFEEKYPKVEATYGNKTSIFEADPNNPPENYFYCRLVWLDFWVDYALENCETPAIVNT